MRVSHFLRVGAAWLVLPLLAGVISPVLRADDKEKPKKEEKKEKEEPWVEVHSAHFVVASDGGEKTARRIADQFEVLGGVLRATMPNARLNTGIPIQILAARDGQSFAKLFPEFPYDKRRPQPNGLFVAGPEKIYIGIRTNVSGPAPYEDIYRDYARLILKLSYRNLSPWLDEGFSGVYGSISFTDKGVRLGRPDPSDMSVLYMSPLLPLDLVFRVDRESPYYTVGEKTTMYFAESRALVHFLLTDPQSTGSKALEKYVAQIETGTDSLEAAKQAFGDLNQLQAKLETYIKQTNAAPSEIPAAGDADPGGSPKILSNAEVEARMGDFLANRGKQGDAQDKLEDALKLDPSLAEAEQSMGYLALHHNELEEAEKHFTRATEINPNDALSYYGQGTVAMSRGGFVGVPIGAVVAFEKTVSLIPDFAPAWYNLASIYALRPDTLQKALTDAQRAASLAPGESGYQLQVTNLTQALSHPVQARTTPTRPPPPPPGLGAVPGAVAGTDPKASNKAGDMTSSTVQQQKTPPGISNGGTGAGSPTSATLHIENKTQPDERPETAPTAAPPSVSNPTAPIISTHVYSMVGTISDVNCSNAPQVQITLKAQNIVMHLHADDLGQVAVKSTGSNEAVKNTACASLRGRTARVSYLLAADKKWDGELQIVEFR